MCVGGIDILSFYDFDKNCTPLVAQGIDVLIVTREVIDNTIIFVFKKAVLNLME
jgi:hypothetical protein